MSHVCSGVCLRESIDGLSGTQVFLVIFHFTRQFKSQREADQQEDPTNTCLLGGPGCVGPFSLKPGCPLECVLLLEESKRGSEHRWMFLPCPLQPVAAVLLEGCRGKRLALSGWLSLPLAHSVVSPVP